MSSRMAVLIYVQILFTFIVPVIGVLWYSLRQERRDRDMVRLADRNRIIMTPVIPTQAAQPGMTQERRRAA